MSSNLRAVRAERHVDEGAASGPRAAPGAEQQEHGGHAEHPGDTPRDEADARRRA